MPLSQKRLSAAASFTASICPIYGVGALAIVLLCQSLFGHPVFLFLFGVLLTSVLEYIASYLLEKFFHTHYWDYTGFLMNINGRVCIPFSFAWGILTVVLVLIIHPAVSRAVTETTPYEASLTVMVLGFAFVLDLLLSVAALLSERDFSESKLLPRQIRRFLAQRKNTAGGTAEESRLIRTLQQKYAEIWARRMWNNYITQHLSDAFPLLTDEKFNETKAELKDRFHQMRGR